MADTHNADYDALAPKLRLALDVLATHDDAYVEGHATEHGHGGIVHFQSAEKLEALGLAEQFYVPGRVTDTLKVRITEAGRRVQSGSSEAKQ